MLHFDKIKTLLFTQIAVGDFVIDAVEHSQLCTCNVSGLYRPGKLNSPRIISATDQSVNVKWTTPESDGGSRITSYVVIYGSPLAPRALYSREIVKGSNTNCTLTDKLWPGRTYQLAVAARNKAGYGQYSDFSSSFVLLEQFGKGIYMLLAVLLHENYFSVILFCFLSNYVSTNCGRVLMKFFST